ncbi:MAG: TonB-dependent receptor [Sphingobacteriales bacterium]|nr:MAG: TonB-dependent receptor [Sphingobacteriales bacterium]
MEKSYRLIALVVALNLVSVVTFAQTTVLQGTVRNSITKELLPAVSITLKGTNEGTFTDERGEFRITTSQKLPITLIVSSIGFEEQEVSAASVGGALSIELVPGSTLGAEVVVSASRVAERILESPVSIERMGSAAVRAAAAPSFYQAMANFKGVDMTTSSLTFNTLSTRGFNGSGNLRFNQLVDGMDNQAPALNFAVGIILGPTELDIDNIELLQGASSALYGPGGMNGTLLMTSKSPFKYQGLSVQVKQGIMHTDNRQRSASPYYDWAFRYGKKVGEKFAFKIGGQFISAKDWQASDSRNLARNNVLSEVKPGDRQTDNNYDGINVYGDEASASMNSFAQVAVSQNLPAVSAGIGQVLGAPPTQQQLDQIFANPGAYIPNIPQTAPLLAGIQQLQPFYLGMRNNVFGGQLVSRTGYEERHLVDYDAFSLKLNAGAYYKITNNVEASLLAYWGTGTTVYTGADRYALKNFKLGQYRAEIRGKRWYVRAYTTQENSGDSYTATTAAVAVNSSWKSNQNWFAQYTGNYGGARLQGATDAQAHAIARNAAETGRLLPGTDAFNQAFDKAISTDIKDGGARFADKSSLYHYEGQWDLSDYTKVVDVLVGGNFRRYHLNSQGTIFVDTAGAININEYGGFIQLQKQLFEDVLKLTASGRYDKSMNFKGRFTPRVTASIKVATDNNIRLSFQTAYRFPSTQDQYINLNTPGSRLIGGLPSFQTYFDFINNPVYTAESIGAFRGSIAAGNPNPALLQQAQFRNLKPESVNSYELGYRGLVTRSFLVDAYVYYSEYKDFIGRVAVGRAATGGNIANPLASENYSYPVNSDNSVKAIGWGLSLDYQLGGGFNARANVSGDQLRDVPDGLITFFNTPKLRYNLGLGNEGIAKTNWGFNLVWRWQDKVNWQGTFGTGSIDAYGTFDAQISHKFPKIRSIAKLGGSNLLNKYYISAFGNPMIGGVYYISFGYNLL